MSKRTYSVSYWIEQGYEVLVEAHSKAQAERMVINALDNENDRLGDCERVHHEHGIASILFIKECPGRRIVRNFPTRGQS